MLKKTNSLIKHKYGDIKLCTISAEYKMQLK